MDQARTPLRVVAGPGSPERLALLTGQGAPAFPSSARPEDERATARRAEAAEPRTRQASDRRATPTVGRHARLELAFERRGNRTILVRSYAEPPFRVARTFDLDGAAYAILVCAGPGLFGGDALTLSVHVARGPRLSYLERYALTPRDRGVARTWIGGGATHFATTVICHPGATRDAVEDLHAHAAGHPDVAAAVDLAEPSLAVARMMSANAASFGRIRASYREWALASIFRRPELRGRK